MSARTKSGRPCIERNGDPWFVAKDVCDVLGIRVDNAMTGLDADEKGHCTVGTPGGDQRVSPGQPENSLFESSGSVTGLRQKVTIVNEYGLYNLVRSSNVLGIRTDNLRRDLDADELAEVSPSTRVAMGFDLRGSAPLIISLPGLYWTTMRRGTTVSAPPAVTSGFP